MIGQLVSTHFAIKKMQQNMHFKKKSKTIKTVARQRDINIKLTYQNI